MGRPNFLLIGIDTLRADHLSCYGYVRGTSPNIDRLARESVVFTRAFANGIPTHPAWTTILTGVHPLRHKIVTHMGFVKLSRELRMVQEVLRERGYATGAVDNMFLKYGHFYAWFTRGFDIYSHPGGIPAPEAGLKVQGRDVTDSALKVLGEIAGSGKPFFLFLHYWDPHSPYRPPPPFNRAFWREGAPEGEELLDYIISQYDGEVAYVDAMVGELLDAMDDRGLLDDTVVIVTADHGEELRQHGDYLGHKGLYDTVTRVPLIIKAPGCEARVVDALVQHVDIAPTILELAGVSGGLDSDGRSLVPLLEGGGAESRPVVMLENTQQKAIGIRTERWKLIRYLERTEDGLPKGYVQLFDLERDPEERVNLAYHETDVSRELGEELDRRVGELLRGGENPLLTQPTATRRIKFYSEAKDLVELYGLIIRYGQLEE